MVEFYLVSICQLKKYVYSIAFLEREYKETIR